MEKKRIYLIILGILIVLIIAGLAFSHSLTGFVINDGQSSDVATMSDSMCKDCNVILVSLDTLRADHLPCYGYDRNTAPNLCKYAENSYQFNNLYSVAPQTLLVHMSLFTSLYPAVHGVLNPDSVLANDKVTLAETLKSAGYKTAGFVDGGYLDASFGYSQGFDNYTNVGYLSSSVPNAYNFMKNNEDNKFFLFLHTFEIHANDINQSKQVYYSPEPYNSAFLRNKSFEFDGCMDSAKNVCAAPLLYGINSMIDRYNKSIGDYLSKPELNYLEDTYDGGILSADAQLQLLFNDLDKLNLSKKTIVIITADHGEEFGEHGKLSHTQLYDNLLHVPLIIHMPGQDKGKKISDSLITSVDVMPTILDMVRVGNISKLQGFSFTNLMSSTRTGNLREYVYSNYGNEYNRPNVSSIRSEDWKFLYSLTNRSKAELYNLKKDPLEQNNVIDQYPEVAKDLAQKISDQIKENSVFLKNYNGVSVQQPSSELLDQLKGLGYIN